MGPHAVIDPERIAVLPNPIAVATLPPLRTRPGAPHRGARPLVDLKGFDL